MTPKTYQDNFFGFHLQDSINSAKEIIPIVSEYIRPTSVIDVGCGVGTWLSIWEKQGVNDVIGIDGSYAYSDDLLIEKDKFIIADLEKGFKVARQFDLVSCLEVAEHIKPENAESFIAAICCLGDIILFSAAVPGQEGTLHYNEQYPDYWINIFSKNNFTAYDCIRPKVWNNAKVSWWYRQNIMFFVRDKAKKKYPSLCNGRTEVLSIVHPELFNGKAAKVANYEKILRNPYTATRYFASQYLGNIKKLLRK